MDETRKLLLATCRNLIKLQDRLYSLTRQPKQYPNGGWETIPSWSISALTPPSPWLEGCPSNTAASGVLGAISVVMMHLIAMVESDKPIDHKAVCLVLQHLTMGGMGSVWGGAVQRYARRMNIQLPLNPFDWHHGLSLEQRELPR